MRRLIVGLFLISLASPAFAQQPERIPVWVLDLRGSFVPMKADTVTADSLSVTTDDLAGHGFGIQTGVQVYPLRHGRFALGLGGEMFLASASHQATDDTTGLPSGPETHRDIRALSGQVSFNFGHREGWSYFSAGLGPVTDDTYLADGIPDGLSQSGNNFGFGARWFNTPHVAFTLDLRFYAVPPGNPTLIVGGRARTTLTVFSAGISLK
jgi:hypothetical protein